MGDAAVYSVLKGQKIHCDGIYGSSGTRWTRPELESSWDWRGSGARKDMQGERANSMGVEAVYSVLQALQWRCNNRSGLSSATLTKAGLESCQFRRVSDT